MPEYSRAAPSPAIPRPVVASDPPPPHPAGERLAGTSNRRVVGRAVDGRAWELSEHDHGVTVLMAQATVAEARIWIHGGRAAIEVWVDGVELPATLTTHLIGRTFAHPAVRAGDVVLVCLPRTEDALVRQVLCHLDDTRSHDAGPARLIEGRIREDSVLLSIPPPRTG